MKRKLLLVVASLAVIGASTVATAWGQMVPEVRPFFGAYFPTGDQRDMVKDGLLVGAQMGVEIAERLHVVGTFSFDPNKVKHGGGNLGIYGYDVGLEAFRPTPMGDAWELRPFIGAGIGGRTYDVENGDTETNFAGYGALGTEFQSGRFALRLEGRDYLSRYRGLSGGLDATTRNDIMMMMGAAIHW